MNKSDAKVGQKVHYIHFEGCNDKQKENGIIKRISEHHAHSAFVVYHCGEEWDHYWDYTGALTDLEDLELGWVDTL